MMANEHLSDEQFAALLAGIEGQAESRHVEACEPCRAQCDALAASLRDWTTAARGHAERPPAFWTHQAAAVLSRTRTRQARRLWTPVAVSAALLLVAAMALTGLSPRQPVSPAPSERNDDALLQQIQQTLSSEVPEALAPATLLTDELNTHGKNSPQVGKENLHEM